MLVRLVIAYLLVAIVPQVAAAQFPDLDLQKMAHDCTFTRACNWSTHAALAFGTTLALRKLRVPPEAAAGAAALLFVGKEVRDHIKWGVLGSADSNGDMLSGAAGALVAYVLIAHPFRSRKTELTVEARERTWFTLKWRK